MKLYELLENINVIKIFGDKDIEIEKLSFNSKDITKNSLFFCLNGTKTKGDLYVDEAIKNGAVAVVTEKLLDDVLTNFSNTIQIVVKNVRKAMSIITANFFGNPQKRLKIVGVTGTSGKSSTSFLIYQMLTISKKRAGLIGTSGVYFDNKKFDYNMTTPDSIDLFHIFAEMVKSNIEYCVMEVSAHAIFFDKIYGIDFAVKALTNVKSDHLDFFGTQKNYENTKKNFFDCGGCFVINTDDKIGKKIFAKNKKNSISYGKNADFCIKNSKFSLNSTNFLFIYNKKEYFVQTKLVGKFNVYNIVCALAVLNCLGLNFEVALKNFDRIKKIAGRCDCVYSKDIFVLIDFAHTTDSLKNLLSTITDVSKNKNIIVFGCPGERDTKKRFEMGMVAGRYCDFVVATTDNPASENPRRIAFEIEQGVLQTKAKYMFVEDRKKAIKRAISIAKKQKNCNVLIVGKGVEEYQIVGDRKIPYSDYMVVDEILNIDKNSD